MTQEDTISLRILLLRSEHQMSQEELATAVHVSRSTVRDWETGSGRPSAVKLHELAQLFHVPMESFFTANDNLDSEMITVPKPLAISVREMLMAIDKMTVNIELHGKAAFHELNRG